MKCPYSELVWSVFSGSQTEYAVWMRENVDRNNSEYEHFLRYERDVLNLNFEAELF